MEVSNEFALKSNNTCIFNSFISLENKDLFKIYIYMENAELFTADTDPKVKIIKLFKPKIVNMFLPIDFKIYFGCS